MLRHIRLEKEQGALRINPTGKKIQGHLEAASSQCDGIPLLRQSVIIRDKVEAVIVILEFNPAFVSPKVIADMQLSGRLAPRYNSSPIHVVLENLILGSIAGRPARITGCFLAKKVATGCQYHCGSGWGRDSLHCHISQTPATPSPCPLVTKATVRSCYAHSRDSVCCPYPPIGLCW
jgi:hypothetical protein